MEFINTEMLELPSDKTIMQLKNENELLRARIQGLELRNQALQQRIAATINDWREVQNKLHSHEISDILCDFIAEYYHNDLLNYLRNKYDELHLEQVLDRVPQTWNEISSKLVSPRLKEICMQSAMFTEEEWDALYTFKRSRNIRVHPKRSKLVLRRIMRELPTGVLRSALAKMVQKMLK
jgi:hypothetical protein